MAVNDIVFVDESVNETGFEEPFSGVDELWEVGEEEKAENVAGTFRDILRKQSASSPTFPHSHLLNALFLLVRPSLIYEYVLSLIDHLLLFSHPFLIRHLLHLVSLPPAPTQRISILRALFTLLFVSLSRTACESQLYWINRKIDARIRTAIASAVLEKAIRTRTAAGGRVANLVSGDAEKIMQLFRQSHYAISVPVLLVLCFGLLVGTVGVWGALRE
ncbi:hypothetical protein BC829DRAFT_5641 [Chytridium lagenaria]|nr:hypothetical protein BC829DRAFT_5641 [Chytridium lagenaria]